MLKHTTYSIAFNTAIIQYYNNGYIYYLNKRLLFRYFMEDILYLLVRTIPNTSISHMLTSFALMVRYIQ